MPNPRSDTGASGPQNPQDGRPWRLPRGRHGLPRETVARSQRERLIGAMVRVAGAKGYSSTSVADVLEASGVGRATFYEMFEDKEDCFLAAHSVLVDDLYAQTTAAYAQPGPWPERVRNGLAALLAWFAEDPDIARVTMLEIATIGPAAQKLFGEQFSRFSALLEEGNEFSDLPEGPPNLANIAGSTVFVHIYEQVVLERVGNLPNLLPQLTFEALFPFLGEEAARAEERKAQVHA